MNTFAAMTALLQALDPEKLLQAGGYLLLFNIWAVLIGVFVAAVAGDQVGYMFGRRAGPALFGRPDSRFSKQEHLEKTGAFFEDHGPRAIVLARFVPVVRTFCPIVAGAGKMHYSDFARYNIVGGFLWAVGVTSLGYFLGNVALIRNNVEIALVAVVAISFLPIAIEVLRSRRAVASTSVGGRTDV